RLASTLRARSGVRGRLGTIAGRKQAARESARGRARLRGRERLRPARPAVRDGGDVGYGRGGLPPGRADRLVAEDVPNAGERDRIAARRGGGALARRRDRLLSGVSARRAAGRRRGEVE